MNKQQTIVAAIALLDRVDLKGSEVKVFVDVRNWLESERVASEAHPTPRDDIELDS